MQALKTSSPRPETPGSRAFFVNPLEPQRRGDAKQNNKEFKMPSKISSMPVNINPIHALPPSSLRLRASAVKEHPDKNPQNADTIPDRFDDPKINISRKKRRF